MASNSEDEVLNNISDIDEDDDLFGDVPDEEPETAPPRMLSDAELDSGDDEGRDDRVPEREDDDELPAEDTRNARILENDIFRHPVPRPSDGQVSTPCSSVMRMSNNFTVPYISPTQVLWY